MSVADAQRELADARAVIVTSDTREFSDVVVIHRKWENVPLEQSQDYLDFLEAEPRSITDPTGCPSGTYRVLRNVYANEDGEREIHQYLAKDLHTTAPVTEGDTAWRNLQSKLWKQSLNENVVLELRYCDPLAVQGILDENPAKTFTDNIFTENVGLLDGKWYSIHQTYAIDPEEGWATVHWFLAKYYNEDLIFTYLSDIDTRAIDFIKLHMIPDAIPEFQDTYYFSENGSYYICTDPATRAYTSKDGIAGSGTLPDDAARVGDPVEGRIVQETQAPQSDTNEITFKVHIEYTAGNSTLSFVEGGGSGGADYDGRVKVLETKDRFVATEYGTGVSEALLTTVRDRYDGPTPAGLFRALEVTRNAKGTWDYKGVETTLTGYETCLELGEQLYYYGWHMPLPPSTDPDAIDTVYTKVTPEGRVVSENAGYNDQDGTWSWRIVSTKSDADEQIFTYKKDSDTTEVDFISIRLDPSKVKTLEETYFFDALGNYYVGLLPVSGIWFATHTNGVYYQDALDYTSGNPPPPMPAGAKRVIDTAAGRTVQESQTHDPKTNEVTLRLKLVFSVTDTVDGGADDPDTITGRTPILEYGEPLKITRLVSSVKGAELPPTQSLIGRYEDVQTPTEDYAASYSNITPTPDSIPDTITATIVVVSSGNTLQPVTLTRVADYGGYPAWSGTGMNILFGGQTWHLSFTDTSFYVSPYSTASLPPKDLWNQSVPNITTPPTYSLTIDYDPPAVRTGRRVTVTRVRNASVANHLFDYELEETTYLAPMLKDDAWMYSGSADLVEKDRRTFYNAVIDSWGSPGWQPGDPGGTVYLIESHTVRSRNVLKERKYFVRRPTAEDVATAGIPDLFLDPNLSPFTSHVIDIRQHGPYLYSLERVTTTLGPAVQTTEDTEPPYSVPTFTPPSD